MKSEIFYKLHKNFPSIYKSIFVCTFHGELNWEHSSSHLFVFLLCFHLETLRYKIYNFYYTLLQYFWRWSNQNKCFSIFFLTFWKKTSFLFASDCFTNIRFEFRFYFMNIHRHTSFLINMCYAFITFSIQTQ